MSVKRKDVYPVGTVVRFRKTGLFAVITDVAFRNNTDDGFLNYLGWIEGKNNLGAGRWVIYHQEVECEVLGDGKTLPDPSTLD